MKLDFFNCYLLLRVRLSVLSDPIAFVRNGSGWTRAGWVPAGLAATTNLIPIPSQLLFKCNDEITKESTFEWK